jgi:tyrosinase
MTQPIPIIGAGIAGLTLSRSLLHRGIPSVLYEKGSSNPRFNYAITLHSTAYQPLLKILDLDVDTFKRRVAVDAESGGTGVITPRANVSSHNGLYDTSSSFRANRAKLEQLLREGLDVRWKHALQSVEKSSQGATLLFANGESCVGKLVVGADGVHSQVRKLLLPSVDPVILPYAVFNGKRRISSKDFDDVFEPAMQESNVVGMKRDDALLSVSVSDRKEKEEEQGGVSLGWIFSRPSRGNADPLHRPTRSTTDAQNIPDELFQEVRALKDLTPPFSVMFDAEKMRRDRILHWLMRTTSAPLPELRDLLARTGVCLMGDAVHAEPILGGNGANAAIVDALMLADAISSNEQDNVLNWYNERYSKWLQGVEESQTSIARMHEPSTQAAANL